MPAPPISPRRSCRLRLELLEERCIPAAGQLKLNTAIAQPDGRILIRGSVLSASFRPTASDFLIRLKGDGSYDRTFAVDGLLILASGLPGYAGIRGLAMQSGGRIVVSSSS